MADTLLAIRGGPITEKCQRVPFHTFMDKARQFFVDLDFAFRLQFGRHMSPAEKQQFQLAEHAVRVQEQVRIEPETDAGG